MTEAPLRQGFGGQAAARWTPVLERTAAFLAVMGLLLREWAGGATAGTGLNLFIHLLPWLALALWFGGRALGGGATWRFTGAEFAILAFAVVSLASALGASFKLAALEHAFAHLSFALLLLFAVQALGPRTLLDLLLPTLFTLAAYAVVQRFVLFPSLPQTGMSEEFRRRVASNEVFATFIGPNAFAGFLALLLPLAGGVLLDRRRGGWAAWAPPAAALALGLWALALTGSRGGWISLAAGAASFAALAATRERRRGLAVGAGAALAAAGILLLLLTPLFEKAAARSHSMDVRRVYWQAAGTVIAEAPLLGKGLGNFQEHYFRVKSERQQEAKTVHNDYLQLLAETGVLGLAAFAAFLGIGLRRALARPTPPSLPVETAPPWLVPAAAAVSFLASSLLAGAFDPGFAFGLGALWILYFLGSRRRTPEGPPVFTRVGAAAGIAALLVHMTVDFDLYEMGVAAALYAVLALAGLLGPAPAEVRLPREVCAGGSIVLFLVAGPLLAFVTPRALAADQEIHAARKALLAHEASPGPERDATQRISDALRLSQSAQEHNPFDPEGYELHARARLHEWDLLRGAARDERALAEIEGISLACLANAIALRPNHAPYQDRKAMHHRLFRGLALEESRRADRRTFALAAAGEHLREALVHQQRAVELYPTLSRRRYALARLLEEAGEAEEAKSHYREALRFSDRAGQELENLDRLKLAPWERARAFKRLDAHTDAQAEVARWLEPLRREPPERVRRLRARPQSLGIPPDELDDVIRPAIEEALDQFLK